MTTPPISNPAILERLGGLATAVISDTLDQLGYRNQVMAPRIRPLYPEAQLAGYASTVHAVTVSDATRGHDQYDPWLATIERLGEGDVLVVSTIDTCYWGEFVSMVALQRRVSGVIIDGFTRDALAIRAMRFPAFVAGIHSADLIGRLEIVEVGGEIQSGDIAVRQGDLVFADYDGVVIIPATIGEETITLAEERLAGEDLARNQLQLGGALSEVFRHIDIYPGPQER